MKTEPFMIFLNNMIQSSMYKCATIVGEMTPGRAHIERVKTKLRKQRYGIQDSDYKPTGKGRLPVPVGSQDVVPFEAPKQQSGGSSRVKIETPPRSSGGSTRKETPKIDMGDTSKGFGSAAFDFAAKNPHLVAGGLVLGAAAVGKWRKNRKKRKLQHHLDRAQAEISRAHRYY
jgi:hypothetical protein